MNSYDIYQYNSSGVCKVYKIGSGKCIRLSSSQHRIYARNSIMSICVSAKVMNRVIARDRKRKVYLKQLDNTFNDVSNIIVDYIQDMGIFCNHD